MSDLYISSCSTDKPASHPTCYFAVDTSRWDSDSQLHSLEFVVTKSQRDDLWNNIVPGRIDSWEFPFSKTYYRDTTYYSGNTLKLSPIAGTNLANIRDEIKIVVKGYREELWGKPADKYYIKLSGYEYEPL